MAKVTEHLISSDTADLLKSSSLEGLHVLGLDKSANPQAVINTLDAFIDAWQVRKRALPDGFDPDDLQYALGSLWGEQLVRQFKWEWGMITFHEHGNSRAAGVLSPDRSLAVYPIHFVLGCLKNPDVDCTVALAFNLLMADEPFAGKQPKPKEYFNLMDGVHRIVPKR